jgi:hypothetical protein
MNEVQIDEHGRPGPPQEGDEAATLLGFLSQRHLAGRGA